MIDEWLYIIRNVTFRWPDGKITTYLNMPGLDVLETLEVEADGYHDLDSNSTRKPYKITLELGPMYARKRTRKEGLQLIWVGLMALLLGCRHAE